ncbi:MAG TPA: hypothetical protein DD490_27065 [Acidobacteria bacterium]|nr:hypothetical protein [Acidobacteriota bacterium]
MNTINRFVGVLAVLPIFFLVACNGGDPGPAPAKTTAATAEVAPALQAPPAVPVAEVAPPARPPLVVSPQVDPIPAAVPAAVAAPVSSKPARDFRAEAAKYIDDYNSYRLTPDQEGIKTAALTKIPAPCCDDNSIATCCCPCNMAKAVWGMSAYLIVEEGYGARQLEKAVRDWLAAANPNGFSGRTCYTGGCGRSFDQDGCGGMVEGYIF